MGNDMKINTDTNNDDKSVLTPEQTARRKLLKMSVYVPPAMLGVMMTMRDASAGPKVGQNEQCATAGGTVGIVISAGGNACCPCVPGATGSVNRGGRVSTKDAYNPNTCNLQNCKFGDCAACQNAIFNKMKDCTKKVVKNGCGCTCTNTPAGVKCI